jgi:hypothetical protein
MRKETERSRTLNGRTKGDHHPWKDLTMITEDEKWLPISQAAVVLGVSERTIRNYITGEKIPVHKDRGRTYVDISAMRQTQETIGIHRDADTPRPAEPAEPGQENALMRIIGAELALRGQAQEMVARADREVEHLREDLHSARRLGRLAWVAAIGFLIAGVAVTARMTGQFKQLDQQLQQAAGAIDSTKAAAAAEREDRNRQIAGLQEEIGKLSASLEAERGKLLAKLESDVLEKQAQARASAEATAKIETLTTAIASAKETVDALQSKAGLLENELKAERAELALNLESKSQLHEEYTREQLDAKRRILELEAQLLAAEERLKAVQVAQNTGQMPRENAPASPPEQPTLASRITTTGEVGTPTMAATTRPIEPEFVGPPAPDEQAQVVRGPASPTPPAATQPASPTTRTVAAGNAKEGP